MKTEQHDNPPVTHLDGPNFSQQPPRTSCVRLLVKWLGYGAVMYVFLVCIIALNETNLVYPVSKYPRGNWQPDFEHEEITLISRDGTKLVGWYLPFPDATENALICHGNAENVAQTASSYGRKFQSRLNANVFIIDYRGYGKSEGEPFEQGVLDDVKAAADWLVNKAGIENNDLILVGHSIGGGPAIHLASVQGAKALFVQRTFASLVQPAAQQYWFLPVNWIMRNRYPSVERIASCNVPLHQSHGDLDTLVPIASGRELFAASPATIKRFYENSGMGHWDALPQNYWHDVVSFLEQVNQLPRYQKQNSEAPETETATDVDAELDGSDKPAKASNNNQTSN